jgi:formamidopyrimidine-DNA glycosylase
MSEWPEIEHYRSQLSSLLCGHRIAGANVHQEKAINESEAQFQEALLGKTILFVERKGKHLLFHLDDGNRLLLTLQPENWLAFSSQAPEPEKSYSAILRLEDGNALFFSLGKAGTLQRMTAKAAIEELKELGPDPLDARLTQEKFSKRLAGKKGRLKTTLTDQRFVSGIGNVYSDEISWEAKLNPAIPVSELDEDAKARLYASMRTVLQEAKEAGGLLRHPLEPTDTSAGGYADKRRVYGREGEPCPACGQPIRFETVAGRKMYFCPHCQS